jgi:hypothetical protein
MDRISKFSFLQRWNEIRKEEDVKIDELPYLDESLLLGGLDLAERIDHTALWVNKWDGQHLDQHAVGEWQGVHYPIIAEKVRVANDKLGGIHKIGYDETGNIAVGYLFSQDLEGIMEPIHATNPIKIDCVRIIKFLSELGVLRLKPGDPVIREIDEQQKVISPSGNQRYEHPTGSHDDRFWGLAFSCYIAVDYIVGMPPAAIVSANDALDMGEDPDDIIENMMSLYRYKWGPT